MPKLPPALLLLAIASTSLPSVASSRACSSTTQNTQNCTVIIDRDSPVTPLPVRVTPGMSVTIEVINRKPGEKIKWDTKDEVSPSVDVVGGIVGKILDPLSKVSSATGPHVQVSEPAISSEKEAYEQGKQLHRKKTAQEMEAERQQAIRDSEDEYRSNYSAEKKKIDGLKLQQDERYGAYRQVSKRVASAAKSTEGLSSSSSKAEVDNAVKSLQYAARRPLQPGALKLLHLKIEALLKDDLDDFSPQDQAELNKLRDELYVRQVELEATADKVTAQQNALDPLGKQLSAVSNSMTAAMSTGIRIVKVNTDGDDHKKTVAVSVQNLYDSTDKTDLGTVVILFSEHRFEASTGALFSLMPARSFANAPQFINGQPKLDSSGKQVTQVTESDKQPAVVFPLVMGHYRLSPEGHIKHTSVAVLLSGGAGLNLNSSTADFVLGPSLRFGTIYISPLLHFGQEKRLDQGVLPNVSLGADPPDPPTYTKWVRKPGFALSYKLTF